jgi:cardiolipin synthase
MASSGHVTIEQSEQAHTSLRILGEQLLSRAAGAPLVAANRVRLLRDATENFPAWLGAIDRAERTILLESYIFADDAVGQRFATALVAAARRGVRVRVVQDWFGARGEGRGIWRRFSGTGVEVRWFNPFRFEAPLRWLRRNHRKSLIVDGRIGFVTGLCIAARWEGDPANGVPPWRDTGVEIEGPAVADLVQAFASAWSEAGSEMDAREIPLRDEIAPAGEVALRVIATEPATAGTYRLDQVIAAAARRTLWLTDAYFVGLPSYVQGLRAAAKDGVDVRLLVPGTSDLGFLKRIGAAGYRPLLEGGIRVYEWEGPMLHAKTAVADCRWARVGSTNLNVASWMGNWELDVAVEDHAFAQQMERMFEADLANARELVLGAPRRRSAAGQDRLVGPNRGREGSAVATAGAIRLTNTVGVALGGYRVLGPAEANLLFPAALALIAIAIIAIVFPKVVVVPFAVACAWVGIALLLRSIQIRRARGRGETGRAQRPLDARGVA